MDTVYANKFQRNFMIFVNEDSGFEEAGKSSGHVRLEIRGGEGKLEAVIHNLRDGKGQYRYALYLVRLSGGSAEYARIGEIKHAAGRAVLRCSFDPRNVGGTARSFNEYDIAAVVVEYADRKINNIICPLAAYRKKSPGWRDSFRKALLAASEGRTEPKQQPCGTVENQVKPETEPSAGGGSAGRYARPEPEQHPAAEPVPYETVGQEPHAQQRPSPYPDGETEPRIQPQPAPYQAAGSEQYSWPEPPTPGEPGPESAPIQPFPGEAPEAEGSADDMAQEKTGIVSPLIPEGINTGCVYLNGNLCDALVNDRSSPDPCGSCRINRGEASEKAQKPGNIDGLQQELDKNFEVFDPFHSGRSDYKWWKVTNPVNLNNILYQNNIRSPLMFNPAVMLAHYRYKHLIVGIFRHKNGRQYVVCGVPGKYMADPIPFGEMNKWAQAQGTRLRYGAFGYWLIYIDPDNGRILKP
jgi:hypothetical protein